jgi:hypothetical protein
MVASPRKRRLPNYEVVGKTILSGVSKSFKLPRVMFGVGYQLLLLCAEDGETCRLSASTEVTNPIGNRDAPLRRQGEQIENRFNIRSNSPRDSKRRVFR